jgi:mono/diheme cytochrome c family protein
MSSARSLEASRAALLVVVLVASGALIGTLLSRSTFETRAAAEAAPAPTPEQERAARVARGKYVVTISGCNDCHTPWVMTERGPEPDMSRMLSGHPSDVKVAPPQGAQQSAEGGWVWSGFATNTAFHGPWGTTYAINLTPEPISGMGIWTEEMFMNALRKGKHFGESRPIQPPMPWQAYGQMTDEDLRSVFAYLRSIPPVKNEVPAYEPPAKKK